MKNRTVLLFTCLLLMLGLSVSAAEISLNDNPEYKNNKNIVIYGNASSEFSEFGIVINRDEASSDFSGESSVKLSAAASDSDGRFGVELSDYFTSGDGKFNIKAYGIYNGQIVYSDNTVTVDKNKYYSRKPSLKSVTASEGTIYPSLTDENNRYYILVNDDSVEMPELMFEKSVITDEATYLKPEDIGGKYEIKLETGFSSRTYSFEVRKIKNISLSLKEYRIKEDGFISESPGNPVTDENNITVLPDSICYATLNTDYLPENFIPLSAQWNTLNPSVECLKATEPGLMTKSFSESYFPQYEKIYENGMLNADKLRVKSDFAFAFRGTEKFEIPSDIQLNFSYFEDIALPVHKNDASSVALSYIEASGGGELYPVFSKNTNEYYAVYEKLESQLPELCIKTENPKATYAVEYGDNICTVKVTSEDKANIQTYTIKYREYKSAVMKLSALSGKRSPYELFNMPFPMTKETPYYGYPGSVTNIAGTGHSHFTAMAFDNSAVTDENIRIASAELQFYMATNCSAGSELEFYRVLKTDWPSSNENKMYFAVANRHINKGAEGVLGTANISYTGGGSSGNTKYYRYYTVPLNVAGFKNTESINIGYIAKYQTNNPPSGTQYNFLWLGKNGAETENGLGMYPSVTIKYFEK